MASREPSSDDKTINDIDELLNEAPVDSAKKDKKRPSSAETAGPSPKQSRAEAGTSDGRGGDPEIGSLRLTKKQALLINYGARVIAGYTSLIMKRNGLDDKAMDKDTAYLALLEHWDAKEEEPKTGSGGDNTAKMELSDANINKLAQIVANKTRGRGQMSRGRSTWSAAAPRGRGAGPGHGSERRGRLIRRRPGGARRMSTGRGGNTAGPSHGGYTDYNQYGYEDQEQFGHDDKYNGAHEVDDYEYYE